MTVSRVLRGTGRISQATSDRVRAAAKELGYRPNPMVQTLMANVRKRGVETTSNIVWVTAQTEVKPPSAALQLVEKGAEARARDLGFELCRFQIPAEMQAPESVCRVLKARGIRGAAIAPITGLGTLPNFPWDDFAVATVGRSLLKPAIHYTMSHYYHTMQQTLDEITARGYQKIGLLIRDPAWEVRSDHGTAMVFQYHCLNQRIDPYLAYPDCGGWGPQDYQSWYQEFQPDVIITDYCYRYQILIEAGLPMDRVGFATLSWHETHPKLSGIKQPFAELGAAVIDLVIAQIHRNERGVPAAPKAMLMEGEWMEGETLAPRQKAG